MSKGHPKVDTRRAPQLLRQLLRYLPHYEPDWTVEEGDGPGRALSEAFARLTENVTGRLNGVPRKNFIAFLDLLGISRLPARPARAAVQFRRVEGFPGTVDAPERSLLIAPPDEEGNERPFETLSPLRLTPGNLTMLVGVDGEQDRIFLPPPSFLQKEIADSGAMTFSVAAFAEGGSSTIQLDAVTGLESDKQQHLRIGLGDSVQDRIIASLDENLVTLTEPLDMAVAADSRVELISHFDVFSGIDRQAHELYLGHPEMLKLEKAAVITVEFKLTSEAGSEVPPLESIWEFWTEVDSEPKWQTMSAADGTRGFTRSGDARLLKPAGEIKEREVSGTKNLWIRCRLAQEIPGGSHSGLPRFESIRLKVSARSEPPLPLDQAFNNGTSLGVDAPFLPFGEHPQRFDQFYFASKEAFSKPGAKVQMNITLEQAVRLGRPAAISNYNGTYIFAVDTNGELVLIKDEFNEQPKWEFLGSPGDSDLPTEAKLQVDSPLAPVHWGADGYWVFAMGTDRTLWVWKSSENEWQSVAPLSAEPLVAGPFSRSNLEVDEDFEVIVADEAGQVIRGGPTSNGELIVNSTEAGAGGEALNFVGLPKNVRSGTTAGSDNAPCIAVDTSGRLYAALGSDEFSSANIAGFSTQPFSWLHSAETLVVFQVRDGTAIAHVLTWDLLLPDPDVTEIELIGLQTNPSFTGSIDGYCKDGTGIPDLSEIRAFGVADDGRLWYFDGTDWEVEPDVGEQFGTRIRSAPCIHKYGDEGFPYESAALVATSRQSALSLLKTRPFDGEVNRLPNEIVLLNGPAPPNPVGRLFELVIDDAQHVSEFFLIDGYEDVGGNQIVTVDTGDPPIGFGHIPNQHDYRIRKPAAGTFNDQMFVDEATATSLYIDTPIMLSDPFEVEAIEIVDSNGDATYFRCIQVFEFPGVPPTLPMPVDVLPPLPTRWRIQLSGQADPAWDLSADKFAVRVWLREEEGTTFDSSSTLGLDISQPGSNNGLQAKSVEFADANTDPKVQRFKLFSPATKVADFNSNWSAQPQLGEEYSILSEDVITQWREYRASGAGEINPVLAWEYWDGNSWLGILGFDPIINDGTDDLRRDGSVEFRIPTDALSGEVAGQENHWLRARLISGDYGRETFTMVSGEDDSGNPTQTLEISRRGLQPPIITSVSLTYKLETSVLPDRCVAYNNLTYVDQTAATANADANFLPFVPLEDSGKAVYFGFDQAMQGGAFRTLIDADERSVDQLSAPEFNWTYRNDRSWLDASADDESNAFTRQDLLTWVFGERITPDTRFGAQRHWIRGTLEEGAEYRDLPLIRGAYANTVWAEQVATVFDEILGSSDGTEFQRFTTVNQPILEGERIEVQEVLSQNEKAELGDQEDTSQADAEGTAQWVRWVEVQDLFESGPEDRHFEIDRASGEIRFGDGRRGRIPPAGVDNIRATEYRWGGGRSGNGVAAGEISALGTAVAGIDSVSNPLPTDGGADTMEVDDMLVLGPAQLSHRDRAVTIEDFEWLAKEASREVAKSRCLAATNDRRGGSAGWVHILIAPWSADKQPRASLELRKRVRRHLEERASSSLKSQTRVYVDTPAYVVVTVDTQITVNDFDVAASVETEARDLLQRYLHPLSGGDDGKGWEFGQGVYASDLYALLNSIDGVDRVDMLEFVADGERATDRVTVDSNALLASGEHQIDIRVEEVT